MKSHRTTTSYALVDALTTWADENDRIIEILEKRIKALETTKAGSSFVDRGGSAGPR